MFTPTTDMSATHVDIGTINPSTDADRSLALRRVASSLDAVHGECHALDASALQRGWASYRAHLGVISALLDEAALAELSTLLPDSATGSEKTLRITLGALRGWTVGHLQYLETVVATGTLLGQLEHAIGDAVSRVDAERAALEDREYHGLYV